MLSSSAYGRNKLLISNVSRRFYNSAENSVTRFLINTLVLSIIRLTGRWWYSWLLPITRGVRLVARRLRWSMLRLKLWHALAIHKQVEHRLSTNVFDSFLVCCHCQVVSVYLQNIIVWKMKKHLDIFPTYWTNFRFLFGFFVFLHFLKNDVDGYCQLLNACYIIAYHIILLLLLF